MNPKRTTLSSLAVVCVIVAVLQAGFSVANANANLSDISHLRTLSVPTPPPTSVYTVLTWVGVLVVLIALGTGLVLKKRRKLIAIVTLALIAAIAVAGLVWFVRASVFYSFDALHTYPRGGDNYFTINCENAGYLEGSFSLDVKLVNASFSEKTTQPYQQVDNSIARFDYTLQPKEKQSTEVYFLIHDNVTGFSISLRNNQNNDFLMTSDSIGETFTSFVKVPLEDSFSSIGVPVPP